MIQMNKENERETSTPKSRSRSSASSTSLSQKPEGDKSDTPERKSRKNSAASSSTTYDDGEMKYGDRLLDDLINTFCDKLQSSCKTKIEGMLAIQFLLAGAKTRAKIDWSEWRKWRYWQWRIWCFRKAHKVEPSQVRAFITGKHNVIQILYDTKRAHYVVVTYMADLKRVIVYDSLHGMEDDWEKSMTECIRKQIHVLFGHIFERNEVLIVIECDYDQQTDDWSCGYRSIACIVDLARQVNPCNTAYCPSTIYDFFNRVLQADVVEWKMFKDTKLGERRRSRERSWQTFVLREDLSMSPRDSPDSSSSNSTPSKTRNRGTSLDAGALTLALHRVKILQNSSRSDKTATSKSSTSKSRTKTPSPTKKSNAHQSRSESNLAIPSAVSLPPKMRRESLHSSADSLSVPISTYRTAQTTRSNSSSAISKDSGIS